MSLLEAFSIGCVADIRTIPRSRRNPQYNQDELPKWIGVSYTHWPELGGLRHACKNSLNEGWRNLSFRGYADYMQSPQFAEAVERLMALGAEQTVAMMCAEAVPWRCHRSLVADALLVRGVEVRHIMTAKPAKAHVMTPFAKVEGLRITYPPEAAPGLVATP